MTIVTLQRYNEICSNIEDYALEERKMPKSSNKFKSFLNKGLINDLVSEEYTEVPEQEEISFEEFSLPNEDIVIEESEERDTEPQSNIDLEMNPETEPVAEVKPVGTSIITESTVVTGDIKTESHVKVEGSIQGDIETKANVTIVGGKVVGNIKGEMIGTRDATIKGDLISNEIVEILEESFVQGNITGNKIYIEGRVVGNINSSGTISLSSSAVVEGDIYTKKLHVEGDAVINGKISMRQ